MNLLRVDLLVLIEPSYDPAGDKQRGAVHVTSTWHAMTVHFDAEGGYGTTMLQLLDHMAVTAKPSERSVGLRPYT